MNKYYLIFIVCISLLFGACAKSPLSKMQQLAKEAQDDGKNWSEDEWENKCKDFQEASLDFLKSKPNDEDLDTADKATIDFISAANKSGLKTVDTMVENMAETIAEAIIKAREDFEKAVDKAKDAMHQSIDEANDAMQQSMDEANDAMQQSINDASDAMLQDIDEVGDD